MTTNVEGFLQDIHANPLDDNPRLILADYLTENDDPRGEFIRLQCERASLDPDDVRALKLEMEELRMLRKHGKEWKDNVPRRPVVDFERGTIAASCSGSAFAEMKTGEWFRRNRLWISTLHLNGSLKSKGSQNLFEGYEHLGSLQCDSAPAGDAGIELVSPLTQLRCLRIYFFQIAGEQISNLRNFRHLRELRIGILGYRLGGGHSLPPNLAQQLGSLPELRILDTGDFTPEATSALPELPALEELRLKNGYFYQDNADVEFLDRMPALKHLTISYDEPTPALTSKLASLKHFRSFTLSFAPTDDQTELALRALPQLEELSLETFRPHHHTAPDYLDAFPRLTKLRIRFGVVISTGCTLSIAKLKRLRVLDFRYSSLLEGALAPLAELPDLEVLYLQSTTLNESTLRDLSKLKTLRYLDLRETEVSREQVKSLQQALSETLIRR